MRINPAYFTREALLSFRKNLVQSIAAITTVALCLIVVGLILLVLFIGGQMINEIKNKVEIEVFLDGPDITTADSKVTQVEMEQELEETMRSWSEVKKIEYISKEQALADFRKKLRNKTDVLRHLRTNPLPASYRVSLKDPEDVVKVANRIKELPNINGLVGDPDENVKYGEDTVKKLFALTRWVSIAAAAFASLLIFVSLVLITNTIRLAIFARRKEISIMRLVGASSWFIRWPFVLEGMLEGLIGAAIAAAALTVVWQTVFSKLASGDVLTFLSFSFNQSAFIELLLLLTMSGVLIGALGSMIALRRFLRI